MRAKIILKIINKRIELSNGNVTRRTDDILTVTTTDRQIEQFPYTLFSVSALRRKLGPRPIMTIALAGLSIITVSAQFKLGETVAAIDGVSMHDVARRCRIALLCSLPRRSSTNQVLFTFTVTVTVTSM